jgi:hypothetical protein
MKKEEGGGYEVGWVGNNTKVKKKKREEGRGII